MRRDLSIVGGTSLPPLGSIVFGSYGASPRLPPWALATVIGIYLAAGAIAWWRGPAPRTAEPRPQLPVLQLDRVVELEAPQPKPEPIAEPVVAPPPPARVEKSKPPPVADQVAPIPKKVVIRKNVPVPKTETAQAAQVVTSDNQGAVADDTSAFDIVTGAGDSYAGGATSASGKSKTAIKEVVATYEQVLLAWIERYKRYPRNALRRGLEGRPVLEIEIDRSGRLLTHRIITSSGHPDLDEAALSMLQRAEPYPPIPANYSEETFVFRFGVDFNVDRR